LVWPIFVGRRGVVTPSKQATALERQRVLGLLKRFGWNATSFQVLEPDFQYWFDGEHACVAYVDTGRAWVSGGAPIAAEDQLSIVAERFVLAARACKRRAVFFATEQRFATLAACESLLIGEQPTWSPAEWRDGLRASRSLREQLRRARAKRIRTRRISPGELAVGNPTRIEIEELIRRWLRTRPMAPMGFLVRVHPFEFVEERRIFIAQSAREIVGLACVVPVYARGGWFVEDLLRAPNAPNGTTELLFDRAMRDAEERGSSYVTLGLAPLAGPVEGWLLAARRFGKALYDFSGLLAFKAKLRPGQWSPIYLSHPVGQSSVLAIYDSLVAFSSVGLLRFGIASFLRGPALVVRALAVLLVPWTIALCLADTRRWFPASWVQWAWVSFDFALGLTLFLLTLRWWRWLADALLIAIAGDTCVTLAQVLGFNLKRARGALELLVLTIAVSAPTVAGVVLWNARRRVALSGR
jgi:phosphatidylglycerol lysyltransferase